MQGGGGVSKEGTGWTVRKIKERTKDENRTMDKDEKETAFKGYAGKAISEEEEEL